MINLKKILGSVKLKLKKTTKIYSTSERGIYLVKNKKSNHKHSYEDCLVTVGDDKYYLAKRCTICDKFRDINFFMVSKKSSFRNTVSLMTKEEILATYKELPRFLVSSLYRDIKMKGKII